MDSIFFASSHNGRVVHTRTGYDAFVPQPLPPVLAWTGRMAGALEQAALRLGEFTGVLETASANQLALLADGDAVRAIRSEGMPMPMTDFFMAAATGTYMGTAARTGWNFAGALQHAQRRLEELPFSLRMLRELHQLLHEGLEDSRATPGQFRRSQNWLGQSGGSLSDAFYVPPPVAEMHVLLDNWERFLHEDNDMPGLAILAMAHCQYLAIHPFLTRNSLTGALAAAVILQHLEVTSRPLPMFGRLLELAAGSLPTMALQVYSTGDWDAWLEWYFSSVTVAAFDTLQCARRLGELHIRLTSQVGEMTSFDAAGPLLALLFRQPATTPRAAAQNTGLAISETADALRVLESQHIVSRTATSNGDIYLAPEIIAILEASPVTTDRYARPF